MQLYLILIATALGPFTATSFSTSIFISIPTFLPTSQRLESHRVSRGQHIKLSARGRKKSAVQPAFTPSKVTDEDGLTPSEDTDEIESVDESEVPELHYDPKAHPIPHQPWRRGNTDGCHDPIEAPWRLEADAIIREAAFGVGATVLDVTWFMATVLVTLDDNLAGVEGPSGPEIRVRDAWTPPQWFDPDDPTPADDYGLYEGEEDGRILDESGAILGIEDDPYGQQEFDTETGELLPARPRPTRDEAVRMFSDSDVEKWISDGMSVAMQDRDERVMKKLSMAEFEAKLLKANEDWGYSSQELEKRARYLRARFLRSEDLAEYYPEEFSKVGYEEPFEKLAMPTIERVDGVDTDALSIVARAIIDALKQPSVEERLRVLSRHEVLLTSIGDPEYLETQGQFDRHRGSDVIVQTQDPFGSNRALKGKLVDRNALDVIINQRGRMVTVPLNMVDYVMLTSQVRP